MGGDGEREIVSEFNLGEKDVKSVAGFSFQGGQRPSPPDEGVLSNTGAEERGFWHVSKMLRNAQWSTRICALHMFELGPTYSGITTRGLPSARVRAFCWWTFCPVVFSFIRRAKFWSLSQR